VKVPFASLDVPCKCHGWTCRRTSRRRGRALLPLRDFLLRAESLCDLLNGGDRRESSLRRVVHQLREYVGCSRTPTSRNSHPPPPHRGAIGSHCRVANERERDALLFKTAVGTEIIIRIASVTRASARITFGTIFRSPESARDVNNRARETELPLWFRLDADVKSRKSVAALGFAGSLLRLTASREINRPGCMYLSWDTFSCRVSCRVYPVMLHCAMNVIIDITGGRLVHTSRVQRG